MAKPTCWEKVKKKDWHYGPMNGVIFKSKATYPVNHLLLIFPNKENKNWRFEDNKDAQTVKFFKTKPLALTYAKSYMGKHDKCKI